MSNAKKKLPRGLRWRGDSIVCVFALEDGSIERRSLGEVSIPYAEEQLSIYRRAVREGTYAKKRPRLETPKETVYRVKDLWGLYLKAYVLAGKKAEWRQRMAWKHLKATFESMRPEQVTTADLIGYQESRLAEGAAAATVNRELSALSAALHHAARVTVEGGKPMLDRVVIFPSNLKEAPPRKGFVVDHQYDVLAANAKPLWLRCLIECAYLFGFRRGEFLPINGASGMHVRQIDFFGRWIHLEAGTTKNDEARKAKMTPKLFELMLACCRDKNPDDYVFTRDNGETVVDPRADWYALCVASKLGQFVTATDRKGKPYQKYVGLQLHDFRRSAIRNMTRRGVPQSVAMKISGHKTLSVFRRYDIGDEADLEAASEKIEAGRTSTSTQTGTVPFSDPAIAFGNGR